MALGLGLSNVSWVFEQDFNLTPLTSVSVFSNGDAGILNWTMNKMAVS